MHPIVPGLPGVDHVPGVCEAVTAMCYGLKQVEMKMMKSSSATRQQAPQLVERNTHICNGRAMQLVAILWNNQQTSASGIED